MIPTPMLAERIYITNTDKGNHNWKHKLEEWPYLVSHSQISIGTVSPDKATLLLVESTIVEERKDERVEGQNTAGNNKTLETKLGSLPGKRSEAENVEIKGRGKR